MPKVERLRKGNHLHAGDPCHYCRRPMTSPKTLGRARPDVEEIGRTATIDHVVPRFSGGSNDVSNLVICCHRCNNLKRGLSYDIFVAFARVVIKQYPDTTTVALRAALRQFIDSLAEIAIRNRRETKRALSLSLLHLGHDLPSGGKNPKHSKKV